MKELSKERLLYWVTTKINVINIKEGIVPPEEETQAYRQICQIIKLHFSEDWQQVKKDLGEFMKKQRPKVTDEFVEKWVEIIRPETPTSIRLAIKDMLEEVGVKIVGQ